MQFFLGVIATKNPNLHAERQEKCYFLQRNCLSPHSLCSSSLSRREAGMHLISVVPWLSWQPKRYLNKTFVFSSYFKSSQQVWRLLRTVGIGHIHHCHDTSVAMATKLTPQYYFRSEVTGDSFIIHQLEYY